MNSNESEKHIEVILGFFLGTLAIAFGYLLFANSCNFIVHSASSISSCRLVGSNFGLAGIVLILMGAVAVIASIAVFMGRRDRKLSSLLAFLEANVGTATQYVMLKAVGSWLVQPSFVPRIG